MGRNDDLAAEAVNSLDWDSVYSAARTRAMNDMTGQFYDHHLAIVIAEMVAANILDKVSR